MSRPVIFQVMLTVAILVNAYFANGGAIAVYTAAFIVIAALKPE